MMSKKIALSAFLLTLGGITLSGTVFSAERPEKFDPAKAMEELKNRRAQSQIVVRGNVDESIRRNRESEAEAQRKMNEAAVKIQGRMGEMSDEAQKLMQKIESYRLRFELDVQKATDIDAQLIASLLDFKKMLEEARGISEEYYNFQKEEARKLIQNWVAILNNSHKSTEDAIQNLLFDLGMVEDK